MMRMEGIEIRKLANNEIEVEFQGEGHTFYNLIKEYVLADERTEFAAYRIEHPLTKKGRLYIRTRRQPELVLSDAVTRLARDMEEIEEFCRKSLEERK
jgi:DNA-directed RNA polymerase subunit L